jgi:hypothetical protein
MGVFHVVILILGEHGEEAVAMKAMEGDDGGELQCLNWWGMLFYFSRGNAT